MMELGALKDTKERRVKRVSLDSKVTWVLRVIRVRVEFQAQEARMVLRALREDRAPLATQVPLDCWVRRASWVFQVCQATQDVRGRRDLLASQDSQGPTERREHGVCLENQVQEERGAPRDPGDREDQEEPQENQDQRVHLVVMVHQGHQEREVFLDHKVLMGSQDQKDLLVLLVKMESLDILDREEKWVSKVKLEPLDLQVLWDYRVLQENLVLWEREDILAHLDHQESKDWQAHLEKKVPRETLEPLVFLVKMDPLV